jgi:hypothetical protein
LRQTDQEIVDQDKLIVKEIKEGQYADPKENPPMGSSGSPILPVSIDQQMQMLGQMPMDPGLESQGASTNAQAQAATKINTKSAEI